MSINELINQSEGRRLEFKGELPTNFDLAKTVVVFANDAGGEIYIGINDGPRQVIAPVFKRLGIIDQWGNGLKMVAEEMESYPEIDLRWKEIGLQFIKKNYQENTKMEDSADNERIPTQSTTQYTTHKLTEAQNMILSYLREHSEATRAELNSHIEGITVNGIKYNLARLQELGLLKRVGSKRYGYWVVLGE